MVRPREYEHMVGEVVRLRGLGHTVREIAHEVGISKSTVHLMLRRVNDANARAV